MTIQEFTHINFGNVRIITKDDGSLWFVAVDICRSLGFGNPRDAVSILDDDEKDYVGISDAIGRIRETTIISEPGLYKLIARSRKPEAKIFDRWVRHEVLPKLRQDKDLANEFDHDDYFEREFAKLHQEFINADISGELAPVPVVQVANEFNLTEEELLIIVNKIGYTKLIDIENGIKCFKIKRYADYVRKELINNNIYGTANNMYNPVFVIPNKAQTMFPISGIMKEFKMNEMDITNLLIKMGKKECISYDEKIGFYINNKKDYDFIRNYLAENEKNPVFVIKK